jgi:transposase
MTIALLGIDLAKNVFALHGVDTADRACLVRPSVRHDQLLEMVAQLPPCTIGMEACSGARHWARQFARFGHTLRLMAAKFVVPYRLSGRRGKNDAADATAMHGFALVYDSAKPCSRGFTFTPSWQQNAA